MDRRMFIQSTGLVAAWVGMSVVLSACSSDDDPAAPNTGPGDLAGQVSSNHGHTVVITAAQISAGSAVTLTLTSGDGHTHTVSLTDTQVAEIEAGTTVSEASSSDSGHAHFATFN